MTITNGEVVFNRRYRTGDFEHKDATVTLSFTLSEDDVPSAKLAAVANLAVKQAMQMTGETLTAAVVDNVALASPPPWETKKEPIIIGLPTGETVVGAERAPDPMASAPIATAEPIENRQAIHVVEPAGITDKDLVDAVTAKNAKMLNAGETKAPVQISKLIFEYVTPPQKVQAIPADKRQEFLDRLAKL